MDSTQARNKPEENVTYPQEGPAYMQAKKPSKEPVTQIQRDSVITREDVPHPLFRLFSTLLVLSPLLIVAALYYGLFNP